MGWYESVYSNGLREEHHNGWAPDFHSFAAFYPALDIGAARLANANEVPDGGRAQPVEIGIERILRGAEPPAVASIPPDLYLRFVVLMAIVLTMLPLRHKPRTIGSAAVSCAMNLIAIGAILWYVLPQWGYNVSVGFMFSPDLTALLVALIIALALATALTFVALVALVRARDSSASTPPT